MSQFITSSFPHWKSRLTTPHIMYQVLLALSPAVIASYYFFGSSSLILIATCLSAATFTEAVWQLLQKKRCTVHDGSVLVTGLLLALSLPPGLPLELAALGSVIAIGIGKQAFGGLGNNPFNPALVGRAFLLISFPVEMTSWPSWKGPTHPPLQESSGATPLDLAEDHIVVDFNALFWGDTSGSLGETCAPALLLGALYLGCRNFLHWRIPAGILGSVSLLTYWDGGDPLFHLLSGGLLLGAFFMATDMVTSPLTYQGHWIFGIGIGLLIWLIRMHGGYPEGVTFAILLMNMTVPLLDYYLIPRPFGRDNLA